MLALRTSVRGAMEGMALFRRKAVPDESTKEQITMERYDYGYRGYTIRKGLVGDWFIGQGGHFFGCFKSEAAAKAAVDELLS